MTAQPFADGEHSTLKPHYITSDYGFNPEPDIDWSTGPRQDIRSLYRRDLERGPLRLLETSWIQMSFTCQDDRQQEHVKFFKIIAMFYHIQNKHYLIVYKFNPKMDA